MGVKLRAQREVLFDFEGRGILAFAHAPETSKQRTDPTGFERYNLRRSEAIFLSGS